MSIFGAAGRIFLVLVGAGAFQGCATVHPQASFTGFGEADPARDARVVADYKSGQGAADAERDVKVLVDTLPEGLAIKDGALQIEEGYQYVTLGKFTFTPTITMGTYWFADYTEGWRKGVCYPQVVLTWLSLGLWIVVPTSWPCWAYLGSTPLDLLADVKKMAHAAGGDLVILGYLGAPSQERVLGGMGYILKADPRLKQGNIKMRPGKLAPGEQRI